MIDIDKLKLRAEMSISRENSVFVEYAIETDKSITIQAIFSLKHRQAKLKQGSPALDFIDDLGNRVLKGIAKKLEARLFVVFHGDDELPPFEIHEVLPNGSTVFVAEVSGQKKEAWETAWQALGLL